MCALKRKMGYGYTYAVVELSMTLDPDAKT